MGDVGYSLEAVHVGHRGAIVSLELSGEEGRSIIARLWPHERLWDAPGGRSFPIQSRDEADVINDLLRGRRIVLDPAGHRWHFHVYLADGAD
jgi:hypothetical protein